MNDWNQADQHAQRAHRFYRAGRWEDALEELKRALDHRPDEVEWMFGMGLTLDALQRFDEAAEAFRRAMQVGGEDAAGLMHMGVDLIRSRQPQAAIEAFERANRLDPDAKMGYIHRILAYAMIDDHDAAELMFYTAMLDEDDEPAGKDTELQAIAYDYLAQSLLLRADFDRAIWCWQETLRLNPGHPEANTQLATIYAKRGQVERSRQHYQRQLRLVPDDTEVLLAFADLLFANNRLAEAGDKFRRALELDPTLALAHQRLGELALINSHEDAAEARFERARQLEPEWPGLHLGLATVAHRRGDLLRSRRLIREELSRGGQTPEQVLDIVALMIDLDLNAEVVHMLNPLLSGADDLLISDDQDYAAALLYRGIAHLSLGNADDGIDDCRRCLQIDPENPRCLLVLGNAHLDRGELDEARTALRRHIELAPHDPMAQRLRSRLLVRRAQAKLLRLGRKMIGWVKPARMGRRR